MENLINFIIGSDANFTPRSIVGIMVFIIIFDGLAYMISSIGGARK